jgi:hypothetical protein
MVFTIEAVIQGFAVSVIPGLAVYVIPGLTRDPSPKRPGCRIKSGMTTRRGCRVRLGMTSMF